MIVIKGVAASPGIAIGRAYLLEDEEIVVNRQEIPEDQLRAEVRRYKAAQKATHRDLDAAEAKVLKLMGKQHARLIDAHRLILRDTLFTQDVPKRIMKEKVNAEFALSEAIESVSRRFEKMEDEFFRERRHDLFDVGKRLLSHLMKRTKRNLADIAEHCVLLSRNLLPSDTLGLHETKILGFATDLGGRTSHTAILAQTLGIPAVVGLSDVSRRARNGDWVVLDGEQGLVIIDPGPEALNKYQKLQQKFQQLDRSLNALKGQPCATKDGKRFELQANLDAPDELKNIVSLQSDGIGLFRTEYLFLNRAEPPAEEEQMRAYAGVFKALDPKPVTVRTADIGGDRLSSLGIDAAKSEINPFMGLRGIRLFMRHPDLFKTQLRAILRAAAAKGGEARILIPMVSSAAEINGARRLLGQVQEDLRAEGAEFAKEAKLGIMVEIPSAALMLDSYLPMIDFVSVGTNDLIQYVLAVDRVNEHVSHLYDPFHPAVLRLLEQVIRAARRSGKPVGICGEMASDLRAVPLLIGMGVDSLSVSPRMLLRVKQAVRGLEAAAMEKMLLRALGCVDSDEVKRLLEEHGL